MREWVSAAEIAKMKLPGFPGSKRGVNLMASRYFWPSRDRNAIGGGREYSVSALLKILPDKARDALLAQIADTASASASLPAPASLPMPISAKAIAACAPVAPVTLADWQRRCADARAALLLEVDRLAAMVGINRAILTMVELAASGQLRPDMQALVPYANARSAKDGARTLSRRSLYRWRDDAKAGIAALAPLDSARPQQLPAWAPAFLKLIRVPSKPSITSVLHDLPGVLPEGVPVPSYDQARRFWHSLSIVEQERGRMGPMGLLSVKGFKRKSTDGLRPLDIVSADGHAFKADVQHPVHGQPFRPEVCAMMDLATRYVFGHSAGLAESTWLIMDMIRCGVEELGQFAVFYTDNGAGFTGSLMTADVTGMLGRVGATPTNSIAGRAQARGKIERLQGTLWKKAARKLRSYNGRDMDNEARRFAVKRMKHDLKTYGASSLLMSWDDFKSFIAAEVRDYNSRPHRSLPQIRDEVTGTKRHMTPAEALAQHREAGWEPMQLPPAVMDDLWRPYEIRTTHRGEVKLPWGRYYDAALVPFGGEKVRVGYNIHDGSRVWVRTADDGRLICVAQRDANVIPEMPQSKMEHARDERQRTRLKLLSEKEELILAERGPGLIEMQAEKPMPMAWELRHAEMVAEFEGEAMRPAESAKIIQFDGPGQRFARALEIERAQAAGLPISAEDARWHADYARSSECRTRRAIAEDFGLDAALEA